MKFLFFPLLFIFAVFTQQANASELAYVQFQNPSFEHQYWIEEAANGKMILKFKDGKAKIQTKVISQGQGTQLSQKLTRIFWESQFRKPVKPEECNVYARLRIPGEKTASVCSQHGKETGWLYGSLIEMNKAFR